MIISKMKPMVYGGERETLYYEIFDDGFGILIKNLRSHPCGYIRVPDKIADRIEESDECDYYNVIWIDADIHGGITFVGEMSDFSGFFVGWDYAHYGDYCYNEFSIGNHGDEKKWTTEEILEEAKDILQALREGRYDI